MLPESSERILSRLTGQRGKPPAQVGAKLGTRTPCASVIGGSNDNPIAPKALPLMVCLSHANAIKQGAPV